MFFGKKVKSMQEDIVINDESITGTLKYVNFDDGSEKFNAYYLTIRIEILDNYRNLKFGLLGKKNQIVRLGNDRLCCVRIVDKEGEQLSVRFNIGNDEVIKLYDLSGLTLEKK